MDGYITGRVILYGVMWIHLSINYPCLDGAIKWHISKKALKTFIGLELIAVTSFIIYDNIQEPPYNGWFLAIVGYAVVYGMICMTYWALYRNTILEKNQVYAMTIIGKETYYGQTYFRGYVVINNREINVFLPQYELKNTQRKQTKIVPVKFEKVLKAEYIIVTLA